MPTPRHTVLCCALIAGLAAGAAGCGKRGRATGPELIKQANRICDQENVRANALPKPNPPANATAVAKYLHDLVVIANRRLKRLEQLPQATGMVQQDFYAFLFIEREETSVLRSIAFHAQGNHPAGELELELARRVMLKAGQNADNTLGACAVPATLRSTNKIVSATKDARGRPVYTSKTLPAITRSGGRATIDNQTAEEVVRKSIEYAGATTVKSLSCPSGGPANPGTTFDCQLRLADGKHGTVTEHVDRGGRRLELFTPGDYHLR